MVPNATRGAPPPCVWAVLPSDLRVADAQVFDALFARIEQFLQPAVAVVRYDCITSLECVLIALMRLGSRAELRHVERHFGVSKTTIQQCLDRFCQVVVDKLKASCVFQPRTKDELDDIMRQIRAQRGLPACAGALDGKHWPISCVAPALWRSMFSCALACACRRGRHDRTTYLNYKEFYSLTMMAWADHRYMCVATLWACVSRARALPLCPCSFGLPRSLSSPPLRVRWYSQFYPGNTSDGFVWKHSNLYYKTFSTAWLPDGVEPMVRVLVLCACSSLLRTVFVRRTSSPTRLLSTHTSPQTLA